MNKCSLFFTLLMVVWGGNIRLFGQIRPENDTIVEEIDTTLFIPENNYSNRYPFIDYAHNFIEWNQCDAITPFFSALGNADNRKVRVLHIGDSHVQSDFYTGNLRNTLQEIFGYGGRGFVFPYKSAGTHSTYDYATYSSGLWDYSRNVSREIKYDIGIAGATIHTSDLNASFSIVFRNRYHSIRNDYTHLRIFCKTDSSSFGLNLTLGKEVIPIKIPVFSSPTNGYVDIVLPRASDTLSISFYQTDSTQTRFECSGLLIESSQDNGVLYSSVGINGAGYRSVLRQSLFEEQLRLYKPDLVVIDVGANDFYPFGFNEKELTNHLTRIINIVRKVAPTGSILLTNSHDLWYRRRNVPFTKNFALFVRKMAEINHCAFYDYYHISGGPYALTTWKKTGLAQADRVHLTYKGYALKAEIMSNAMLTSYREYIENSPDVLVSNSFTSETVDFDENLSDSALQAIPVVQPKSLVSSVIPKNTVVYYVVKKHETISAIAGKFNITNSDIKQWNNLKDNKLFVGQKIRVIPPVVVDKKASNTSKNKGAVSKKTIFHKVQKGETLSHISAKYGVSVAQIKKLNRLKSDKINLGTNLKIQ